MPRSSLANKLNAQGKKKTSTSKDTPVKRHRKANPKPAPPQPEPIVQTAPNKEAAVNGVWFDPNEQYRTCKQDGNLLQQAIDNGWKVPQKAKDELPTMLQSCLEKLVQDAADNPFAIPAIAKLATVELAMDAANREEIKLALSLKKDLRDERELEHKLANPQNPNGTTVNLQVVVQQRLANMSLEQQRQHLEKIRQLRALVLVGPQTVVEEGK